MKNTFTSLMLIVFSFAAIAQEYNPVIDSLISEVNQDTLVSFVRILSGEDSVYINGQKELIDQRVYNSNDLAKDYIKQKLESYDLTPIEQAFSNNGTNVFAIQEGTTMPDKYYIICAHYDAVTYYAADDNASGTAVVLEAARLMSNMEFPHSLVYALWDEEEIGLLGSAFYASQAEMNGMNILGVINIDMIGWDGDDDGLVELHSNYLADSDKIANAMVDVNTDYNLTLEPVIEEPGTGASDHASFWNNGFGAILLIEGYWSGDFNPYYHTPADRISEFNLPYFYKASQLAIGSIATLASYVGFVSIEESDEQRISLSNYPNPFSTVTTVEYNVHDDGYVQLSLFNGYGQQMRTLFEGHSNKEVHSLSLNATGLPVGIYTIVMHTRREIITRQIVISR